MSTVVAAPLTCLSYVCALKRDDWQTQHMEMLQNLSSRFWAGYGSDLAEPVSVPIF
jgi:hypothetical protein